MAKPTIVTRTTKGSALTWTEGDANITNLRDATLTVKAGTGGTDVVNDLNGIITLVAGTNVTLSGDNTAKTVTINASGSSGLANVVEDTTPQLGGALDVNGFAITSATNGNISIEPNGTGDVYLTTDLVRVGDSNANATITTNGTGDLILSTNSGSNSGVITIQDGLDNDITLVPAGTGKVHFETSETRVGINNTNAKITTKGTGDLTLDTNSGTNSGSIVIADGVNGNITLTPNGTGNIVLEAQNWPQADGTANYILKTNGAGQLSWTANALTATTATTATNVTVTQVSTSATYYPLMSTTSGTGDKAPVLGTNFTMNPSSGALTAVSLTTSGSITPNSTGGPNINFGTSTLTANAWTTLGISLRQQARNYTDSSSTGTVAVSAINGFGISTLNSTNAITVTEASTFYIQPPAATGNTTITTAYGLISTGRIKASDFVGTVGATTASTGAFTTLSASTSVSFSPSGAITLNPTTAGTINNMSIGATTATTGRFTTITSTIATGTAPFTVASTTQVANLNAATAGTATKSTNLVGGNGTTLLGSIPYQSAADTTTLLSPNTTTTNKFLAQVGDGTNGMAPMWQAITTLDNVMIGSATANTGNFTTLTVKAGNELRLADTDSSNYVGFKSPGTVSANKVWTLPSTDGTSGQVLSTDGAATLSWATAGGGGSNTVILYMGSQLGFPTGTDVITNSSWTLLSTGGISGVSATSNTVTLPAGTYLFEFPIMNYTSNDNSYPAFIIKNNTAGTTLATIDNITTLTVLYAGSTQVPVIWAPKYYFTLSSSSSISLYKSGSFPSSQKYFNDPRSGNLIYKITKA